jgi:predicted RecA/RadA family phage recombinase
MAINEVYDDVDNFPITVPAGVVSGDPVAIGTLVGVALIDRQADGKTVIARRGCYELTVTGAITLGAPVYAVVAADLVTSLTATVGTNIRFGTAGAAQAATGSIPVILGYP